MAGERQLSDGNDAGQILGQSATDLIGFHGKAPSDQRAFSSIAAAATVATAVSHIQEIYALLIEKGLMAAS
jgi:hypothetical protein